jgi:hypothetical protein
MIGILMVATAAILPFLIVLMLLALVGSLLADLAENDPLVGRAR